MKNKKVISVSIVCTALSGCSTFTPPMEIPVIEDSSGHLGTFTTVAERRLIISKKHYKKYEDKDYKFNDDDYDSKFCAEPPPDASQSIASAITGALRGSASGLSAKPEVSIEFAKSLETTVKSLFQRSQGVQLFRDGLYNLCQAHLNGAITATQYHDNYNKLLMKASEVIKDEVEKMPSVPILRAEEAATASEAAKDAAVKAKISVATTKTEIEALLKKVQAAATRAEDAAVKAGSPG